MLLPLLDKYPQKDEADCLRNGFTHGFKLGYSGPRESTQASNPKSVNQNLDIARQKLMDEVKLGRMAGPFEKLPIQNLKVPIGLIPKSLPGTFRLIHNLSYPEFDSINEGIDKELCAVHYTKFDDAIQLVVRAGKDALLAKADIKSAFRLLPIHPADFCLLGIHIGSHYFVDKALPMGASCAPALFETFSTFLEWVVRMQSGADGIRHYADDFLFMGERIG